MNVIFLCDNIVVGGVETTLINYLKIILCSRVVSNITLITNRSIDNMVFQDFINKNPEIELLVIKFAREKHSINKFNFILRGYKRLVRVYNKHKSKIELQKILRRKNSIIIDFKNLSYRKYLTDINNPKIVWIHGGFQYIKHNLNNIIIHNGAACYDKIVCLTKDCVHNVCLTYPQISHKVVNIYNPIDVLHIQQLSKSQSSCNIPFKYYFCMVARLDIEKDHVTLLKAFNEFNKIYPEIGLVLLGDGKLKDELITLASNLGISGNVLFAGSVKNPFPIMKNAIANILSTPQEGLPNCLIEGQVLKVLNISSDCQSGPPEILLHGKGGILFRTGDHIDLYNKLCYVVNHYDFVSRSYSPEIIKLIDNSYEALQRFSFAAVADQFNKLINDVCSTK